MTKYYEHTDTFYTVVVESHCPVRLIVVPHTPDKSTEPFSLYVFSITCYECYKVSLNAKCEMSWLTLANQKPVFSPTMRCNESPSWKLKRTNQVTHVGTHTSQNQHTSRIMNQVITLVLGKFYSFIRQPFDLDDFGL